MPQWGTPATSPRNLIGADVDWMGVRSYSVQACWYCNCKDGLQAHVAWRGMTSIHCRTQIVLNLADGAPTLEYYDDVDGASKLPYVCEIDVAVRIQPNVQGALNFGKLVSFAGMSRSSLP